MEIQAYPNFVVVLKIRFSEPSNKHTKTRKKSKNFQVFPFQIGTLKNELHLKTSGIQIESAMIFMHLFLISIDTQLHVIQQIEIRPDNSEIKIPEGRQKIFPGI